MTGVINNVVSIYATLEVRGLAFICIYRIWNDEKMTSCNKFKYDHTDNK